MNVHVTVVLPEMEFSVMTSTNATSKLITVTRPLPPVTIKKAISNAPVLTDIPETVSLARNSMNV